MQHYTAEKKGTMGTLEEIAKSWNALDADGKAAYTKMGEDDAKRFETEMKEFKSSDDGKKYIRDLNLAQRKRRLLAAKNKYLDDLPKKPDGAIKTFQLSRIKQVRTENAGKKGFELRQILQTAWTNLSEEERKKINDAAAERLQKFQDDMKAFKESANWLNFQKMVKPKASAKGGSAPKVPDTMPKKPLAAFQTWMKEVSGKYKSLKEYADAFKEVDADKKAELNKEAKERDEKFKQDLKAWKETPEAKKWERMKAAYTKNKAVKMAKDKFLVGQPKKPANAFAQFSEEKKPALLEAGSKGPEVATKLVAMWKELAADAKEPYITKEKEAMEKFNEEMKEFKASANYKKYEAIMKRGGGGGKGKSAKGKKAKAEKADVPMPDAPENLPKRPLNGLNLYGKEQREAGKNLNLKAMSQAWVALGAEGQKPFLDQAKELSTKFEKDMMEFRKSAEGKKYFREKAQATKKAKGAKAKAKFLGGSAEPKRPPSAYFIFVSEKRSTLESGLKLGEIAKKLTELWKALEPDDKKTYETKAEDLKKEYEEKMKEYKNSDGYKKFQKAVVEPKAKGKAPAAMKAGRGGGRGGGAEKKAGRGRGGGAAPAPKKAAAASSDSDVMGSDSDDSSNSSNSDSD